jgi:hypothetical protein
MIEPSPDSRHYFPEEHKRIERRYRNHGIVIQVLFFSFFGGMILAITLAERGPSPIGIGVILLSAIGLFVVMGRANGLYERDVKELEDRTAEKNREKMQKVLEAEKINMENNKGNIIYKSYVENSFNKYNNNVNEDLKNTLITLEKIVIASKNNEAFQYFELLKREIASDNTNTIAAKSYWNSMTSVLPHIKNFTDIVTNMNKIFSI